ncbi:MAG: recombinase family protein [Anaerolineae bacterium]|nr:recombinase family protein [Anaerolineae bacterium]
MWKPPTDTAIYEIVRNPAYAGAFVWAKAPHAGATASRAGASAAREWIAIVGDVYPAYITWAQYEANQAQLVRMEAHRRCQILRAVGATREGPGLLQGLAVCADTAATIVK